MSFKWGSFIQADQFERCPSPVNSKEWPTRRVSNAENTDGAR